MQFVGLALGIIIGGVLGLPIVLDVVALPMLAGAVVVPPTFASIPLLAVTSLGAFLLLVLATVFEYVLVSFGVTTLTPGAAATTDWREELGRGLLIGQNTALNFMLLMIWVVPGAQILAAVVFVVNAVAVERAVSNSPLYQVALAYTGLFMPMSLPLNVLGFLIGVFNTAMVALGVRLVVFPDWTRAALVSHGGVVHFAPTAWDLANFIQAHPAMDRSVPWIAPPSFLGGGGDEQFLTVDGSVRHEASHTLSAAAFGWIFHIVGFLGEFIPAPNPDTYAELVAESGLRRAPANWVDFWAPAAGAPANIPPILSASVTVGPRVVDLGGATVVAVRKGTPVPMTAAASSDADAFPSPLGFLWRATDPLGLPIGLGTGATATLTPPTGGTFAVDTFVTDGADGLGSRIVINVTGAIIAPVAGPLAVNTSITIDGSASSVGAPAVVTASFAWSLDPTSIPPGATASVVPSANPAFATFTTDTPGSYKVDLILTGTMIDAAGAVATLSDPASTTVTV